MPSQYHFIIIFIALTFTFIPSTLDKQLTRSNIDLYHVNIHITSKQLGCLGLGFVVSLVACGWLPGMGEGDYMGQRVFAKGC